MSQALFPGWRPSGPERQALSTLVDAIERVRPADAPALRPRRPDQWHVTLCFIGYGMREAATPALLDAFARVASRIPLHRFSIARVVYWPDSGAVAALPHACPALQALCDATRDAIRAQGIRPLQVTTQPHVTLAYFDKHELPQPWLAHVDYGDASFEVDHFELLFNPGGHYESLGQWQLTGDALPVAPTQGMLL